MDQQANFYGHGISFNCWPADLHPISDEKHIVDFVSQFPSHFFCPCYKFSNIGLKSRHSLLTTFLRDDKIKMVYYEIIKYKLVHLVLHLASVYISQFSFS